MNKSLTCRIVSTLKSNATGQMKQLRVQIRILPVNLVLNSSFRNAINDVTRKYYVLQKKDFRNFQNTNIKLEKSKLDIEFLTNCRKFGVIPKFLLFNHPNTNNYDIQYIRKRLLRSSIIKRTKKKREHERKQLKILDHFKSILQPIDYLQ